jgi:hypothetical protein
MAISNDGRGDWTRHYQPVIDMLHQRLCPDGILYASSPALIVSWPNRHPTVQKLRLLLSAMSKGELTSAVSLCNVCEQNVLNGKDCSEFAIQILGALLNASSGQLRSTIERLVCFQLTTQLASPGLRTFATEPSSFFLHLPICGSSNLIECLDLFFAPTEPDAESALARQYFICSFPKFLLIHLKRYVLSGDHLEKNCQRIAFPIVLDMTPYAVERHACHRYQLVDIIPHIGRPQEHLGHYIAFLRLLGQWVRFNDVEVDPVEESAALQDNFPDKDGSTQTASILLYMAENCTSPL